MIVTKFLNATVTNINSSLGWNEQVSSLTVQLVEDRANGDRYLDPGEGSYAVFECGNFTFEGIIQLSVRKNDFGGNPTYEVRLVDPRELLSGVQVIISSYMGSTQGLPNLLNAYGYWETTLGFGGSLVNESGMLWDSTVDFLNINGVYPDLNISDTNMRVGIKPAIEALTLDGGDFGSGIVFKGRAYPIDLGGLPTVLPYYRIGGVSRTILDMVSELCQDAGYDFTVYMENGTIKFRCVSRLNPPVIGTIAKWIDQQTNVIDKNVGVELRNEPTNAMLIGGDAQYLYQVNNGAGDDTIWPFWGFDVDGHLIIGTGDPQIDHEFYLNSGEILDLYGSTSYHCSIDELRWSLGNYESWAFYVMKYWPDKAAQIGLRNTLDWQSSFASLFDDVLLQRDFITENSDDAEVFGEMNSNDYFTNRAQRVYNFVRGYAEEFYGRKFLVRLPFTIYYKMEPETTLVVTSDEVSDGGYVVEGSQPLGLPYVDENKFMTDDGRHQCFVAFGYDRHIDFSNINYENAAFDNNRLFMRATVDNQIVYRADSLLPHVVITLADPVFAIYPDPLGGVDLIADMMEVSQDAIINAVGVRHGSFPVRLGNSTFRPQSVAIPMRSNRFSYGPWGTFGPYSTPGVPGKTIFERDESLTPWNYGDYDTMNQAAGAKLGGVTSNMQQIETGSVTMTETPRISLFEALVEGGPNVTSIDVNMGISGFTTTYEMRTYTPQFGAFARANADRLKRLGVAAQQIRRSLRAIFQRQSDFNNPITSQFQGFMEYAAHPVRQMTPHDTLLASMIASDKHGYRSSASFQTIDEMMANMRADNGNIFNSMGGMSLEGLYRPFSLNFDEITDMPHFERANSKVYKKGYTTEQLDPIRDSDIDIVISGDGYNGKLHRLKNGIDYDTARGASFRGPLVLVGWGAEYTGKPLPNKGDETLPVYQWENDFIDLPAQHPESFRSGIVALHWDDWRKVWTVPTTLNGVLDADMTDNTLGKTGVLMSIKVDGDDLGDKVMVYNRLGGTPKAGKNAIASYDQLANKWYLVACAC